MRLVRQVDQIEVLVGLHQSMDELKRRAGENVLVQLTHHDEQVPLETPRLLPSVDDIPVLWYLARPGPQLAPVAVHGTTLERSPVIIEIHVLHAPRRRARDTDLVEVGELQHPSERTPTAVRAADDAH